MLDSFQCDSEVSTEAGQDHSGLDACLFQRNLVGTADPFVTGDTLGIAISPIERALARTRGANLEVEPYSVTKIDILSTALSDGDDESIGDQFP